MTKAEFVEIRIAYPGHPHLASIDGLDKSGYLNRIWLGNLLLHRRERLEDGKQFQVHRLPLIDAVYEVAETVGGCRGRRYVATRQGDPTLYSLTRDQVEAIAENMTTIGLVIGAQVSCDDVSRDRVSRDEVSYDEVSRDLVSGVKARDDQHPNNDADRCAQEDGRA